MSHLRSELARVATTKAFHIRRSVGCAFWNPVCVYDLAHGLGLEVRFFDIPSMEGMYCASSTPTLIVSSLRPPGRQVFTCAHELGHHAFGHGDQIDELVEQRSKACPFDPREFQADCFAGALLMPKVVVTRGFALRGWELAKCPPEGFYIVATWLGIGYTTLIHHLRQALGMISETRAAGLLCFSPKALRSALLGRECREHLVVADRHWYGRAIDLQVGDLLHLPPSVRVEGRCTEIIEDASGHSLARAASLGIGRVAVGSQDWSAYIRVSRKGYIGRGMYRFEEEADDGE